MWRAADRLLNRCSLRHSSCSRPIRLSTRPFCIDLTGAMECQATPRSACQPRMACEVSSVPLSLTIISGRPRGLHETPPAKPAPGCRDHRNSCKSAAPPPRCCAPRSGAAPRTNRARPRRRALPAPGVALEPLIHGVGHEGGRRRAGTECAPLTVGLGMACELGQDLVPMADTRPAQPVLARAAGSPRRTRGLERPSGAPVAEHAVDMHVQDCRYPPLTTPSGALWGRGGEPGRRAAKRVGARNANEASARRPMTVLDLAGPATSARPGRGARSTGSVPRWQAALPPFAARTRRGAAAVAMSQR
jgi:hypothetical protein